MSIVATRDEVTRRPDTARAGSGSVGEVPDFASEELAEKNQCAPTKARRGIAPWIALCSNELDCSSGVWIKFGERSNEV